MVDSPNKDTPRQLLRWVENPGDGSKEPGTGSGSDDRTGSNSDTPEVTLPGKREEWYGAKVRRLKETVEKLRKDFRDKERDNLRLKNKYTASKRKQEQLQEDINKQSEVKLDRSSEVELLRLQLIEREKELSGYRGTDELGENGGKTKPGEDCGHEDGVCNDEPLLENYMSGSFFERKYLNLHKDTRRKFLYGIFGVACCLSLIALLLGSTFLSTIAVALWTLDFCCLWQERRELLRVTKLRHLKQIREMSSANVQLRQEKTKLETEYEGKIANEIREKDEITSKLSERIGEEMAKNEELTKQEKGIVQELQSERVSRRLAEQRLEEVSAQALLAREVKCGDICKKLRDVLRSEQEEKEKLSRENKRLIEEIVGLNMKEGKWKIEKAEFDVVEMKGRKKEEDMVDAGMKNGEMEKEVVEMKERKKEEDMVDAEQKTEHSKSEIQAAAQSNVLESKGSFPEISSDELSEKVSDVAPSRCWLCAFKIPRETRVVLYLIFLACFVISLKSVLSSKVYLLISLLSIIVVGALSYLRLAKDKNIKIS